MLQTEPSTSHDDPIAAAAAVAAAEAAMKATKLHMEHHAHLVANGMASDAAHAKASHFALWGITLNDAKAEETAKIREKREEADQAAVTAVLAHTADTSSSAQLTTTHEPRHTPTPTPGPDQDSSSDDSEDDTASRDDFGIRKTLLVKDIATEGKHFVLCGRHRSVNLEKNLLQNIKQSPFYLDLRKRVRTFKQALKDIPKTVKYLNAWQCKNSTAEFPCSPAFCYLFHLHRLSADVKMGLRRRQVDQLIRNQKFPYMRCIGLLYLRFMIYEDNNLYDYLRQFFTESTVVAMDQEAKQTIAIGELAVRLLRDTECLETDLPLMSTKMHNHFKDKLLQWNPNVFEPEETESSSRLRHNRHKGAAWLARLNDEQPRRFRSTFTAVYGAGDDTCNSVPPSSVPVSHDQPRHLHQEEKEHKIEDEAIQVKRRKKNAVQQQQKKKKKTPVKLKQNLQLVADLFAAKRKAEQAQAQAKSDDPTD
eukprot:TRINITY_DN85447_c0_g1_i1.p1 TRINITY_DN85447_c0_g1~~TRINITY_DN85447_c0_g1_i1.p1  ORF type:complete len:478 (-),score=39.14 TRINITY_DN85447_c0_g1_i1:79-1512(-)